MALEIGTSPFTNQIGRLEVLKHLEDLVEMLKPICPELTTDEAKHIAK